MVWEGEREKEAEVIFFSGCWSNIGFINEARWLLPAIKLDVNSSVR